MEADVIWSGQGRDARVVRERKLLEALERLSLDRLERSARQLQQSDILALAQFPSQPHVLIHHVVATLHTVLLSMALAHQRTDVLGIIPWAALRLEVLANLEEIWLKMWKRLAKLRRPHNDPRRRPLAIAQVRFVLQCVLLPAVASDVNVLEMYGRVSSVAESICAFVLLCACYTLSPPEVLSPSKPISAVAALPALLPSHQPLQLPTEDVSALPTSKTSRTWKSGVKRMGRFFLFRAGVSTSTSHASDGAGESVSGEYSLLAIDRRRAALEWHRTVAGQQSSGRQTTLNARSWSKRVAMPPNIARVFADSNQKPTSLGPLATRSLLLQSAMITELFTSPATLFQSPCQHIHFPAAEIELRFSIRIVAVTAEPTAMSSERQLKLVAVGEAQLVGTTATLSDVRRQVLAFGFSFNSTRLASAPSFHFFVQGRLVPIDEEPRRSALCLLPLVVLCVDDAQPPSKPTKRHWRRWGSTLLKLDQALGMVLAKQLSPCTTSLTSHSPIEVSLFGMNQSIASQSSPSSGCFVHHSSTIDTLISVFADWSAFIEFQQLQDSTAIFHEVGLSPKRTRVREIKQIESEGTPEVLRSDPTPAELEPLSLLHGRFRPEQEYLLPLYASFTAKSRNRGYLQSPYLDEFTTALASASQANPTRLVVETEECVIHVSHVCVDTCKISRRGGLELRLALTFALDALCPEETLLTMRDVYVWRVAPIVAKLDSGRHSPPPRWLRDVLRFVIHPTWDFQARGAASWPFPDRFFTVQVPHSQLEQIVEATFWSRDIDWRVQRDSCDVEKDLLHPKYDALCHSHPPSFSIDSVKFSKFLRESGLQPAHLSVGDAALLFTRNRASGSNHEMIYDGFLEAMKWIAARVLQAQSDSLDDRHFRTFCFEWLLRAPSMTDIWQCVIDRWRLTEKLGYMEKAATQYCAATRIQANWKRLIARRLVVVTLTRLKNERRAAAKIQSMFKMQKPRKNFVKLKTGVIHTQLYLRARRHLRRLRIEQAELVERMRRRLQKWMRQRLRVLRCWSMINAAWLARRSRIREKRSRLVCAAVYQLDFRRFRVSLYHSTSQLDADSDNRLTSSRSDTTYSLELLEPLTSWFRSISVTEKTLVMLSDDAEGVLSQPKPIHGRGQNRWKLRVLVQRLFLKRKRKKQATTMSPPGNPLLGNELVQIYRDPVDTSLGRLVFQGSVREGDLSDAAGVCKLRHVRLLLSSYDFTLLTYSPHSSTKLRVTFKASFVYRLFQVYRGQGLTLDNDCDEMMARSKVIAALTCPADRLRTIRLILRYVKHNGTKRPTRDMMPEAVEMRKRAHQEIIDRARVEQERRQSALVVMAQANARRFLAKKYVQRVALTMYTKSFDPSLRQIVFKCHRIDDVLIYLEKPPSLGDRDTALPVDEWQFNAEASAYFNPLRGVFSRINDDQAALRLQRWFRRAMWAKILPGWNLQSLTQALLFQRNVRSPISETDLLELDHVTNSALQLHLIHHDYKSASRLYEAALKLSPCHVPALVGLAVLLIHTCRYPAKQTWSRGLQLLDRARTADPRLSKSLLAVEQNCFRWAVFLLPRNANALGNFAVFLQCVRGELDKAELLYRRAIDIDASNECIVENYLRLQRERCPEGIYSEAGPSKIAVSRAQEMGRDPNSDWREMKDSCARVTTASRFFQNLRTGKCAWTKPQVDAQEPPSLLPE